MKSPDEEIRRLQRENEGVKGGERDLKKSIGHLLKTPKIKYQFIEKTPFRVCGEEDVPGAGCFQERLLFMGKA